MDVCSLLKFYFFFDSTLSECTEVVNVLHFLHLDISPALFYFFIDEKKKGLSKVFDEG